MTLSIQVYPPSSSRVYIGNTFPPLFDPITIRYGDNRLMRIPSHIGRKYDLFTNSSAVANFSSHSFLIHNENNWFGEETLFPSGHKNARVDILFNGNIVWQGIVRDAIHSREKQHIELRAEDILSRIMRLPFGLTADLIEQGYEFAEDNISIEGHYTNLMAAIQRTLSFTPEAAVDNSTLPRVRTAAGFLSEQLLVHPIGMTRQQHAIMTDQPNPNVPLSGQPVILNRNERSTFRQRLLPILSALGMALIPDYSDPGRLFLRAAKRGGSDVVTNLYPEAYDRLDNDDYPVLTDDDVKAGSYREQPAEEQVINAVRVKVWDYDEEIFYRGDSSFGSRAAISRLVYGQRVPPVMDFTLIRNLSQQFPPTDDNPDEFDVRLHPLLKAWLDFLLEKRAFGARRCEVAVGLERLEQILAAAPTPPSFVRNWDLPIIPFHHAFRLDLWFNNLSTPPVRGWWYVIGSALNYEKNEIILYLEEGERNGWSYSQANVGRPGTNLSGPVL